MLMLCLRLLRQLGDQEDLIAQQEGMGFDSFNDFNGDDDDGEDEGDVSSNSFNCFMSHTWGDDHDFFY